LEGITFSLRESIDIFRKAGKQVDSVISIGGGAKSELWLQLQADIFNAEVTCLDNEQGPGMGAAMLAAYGCGWFDSLEACSSVFIKRTGRYQPDPERAALYDQIFAVYQHGSALTA